MELQDADPLAETRRDIAAGRLDLAEERLREAIERSPRSLELHAELLEVLAAARRVDPYFIAALKVMALTRGRGPVWERAMRLGLDINPGNRLFQADPPSERWFRPRLGDAFRFAGVIFLALFVLFGSLFLVIELFRDGLFRAWVWINLFQMFAFFGGLGVLATAVLHFGSWWCRWSIEPEGLRGCNYWGRRRFIRWDDVGRVEDVTQRMGGWPTFMVVSASSGAEIWAYTRGINVWDAHNQLCRRAGAEHPVTAWFREKHFAPID